MWKLIYAFLMVSFFNGSNSGISGINVEVAIQNKQCNRHVTSNASSCHPWPYIYGTGHPRRLRVGYCSTYDEDTGISYYATCPYFYSDAFEALEDHYDYVWYIELPQNICALNDFMCGPLNRKGRVCSECRDGYGLAVTSVGFQIPCSKCTHTWHSVLLFLFVELVPITIFYILILVFRINITSAPMTCYILISQLITTWWRFSFKGEDLHVNRRMFMLNGHLDLFTKVMLSVYDMWNLHFFRSFVPPFCISSKIKPFHIGLLGYTSIFYPLCLIVLTWISIELHDSNFKPLVLL